MEKKIWIALGLYFFAVVMVGALLAPGVAQGGNWAVSHWPWLPWKISTPFPRYFDRSLMIVALVGLWPLARVVGVRSRADVGLGKNPSFSLQLFIGLGIAIGSSLLLLVMAFATPLNPLQSFPATNLDEWIHGVLPKGMVRAPLVACVEELFFRGFLLGLLLRCYSPMVAISGSSLFFSAVHFLKKASVPNDFEILWSSGFELIPRSLSAFCQPWDMAPHFVNLTLVGSLLGWAFWKTRSLALPIGLHAGWVLMTAGTVTLGWPATPVLVATFGVLVWITKSFQEAS